MPKEQIETKVPSPTPPPTKKKTKFRPKKGRLISAGVSNMAESLEDTERRLTTEEARRRQQDDPPPQKPMFSSMPKSVGSILKVIRAYYSVPPGLQCIWIYRGFSVRRCVTWNWNMFSFELNALSLEFLSQLTLNVGELHCPLKHYNVFAVLGSLHQLYWLFKSYYVRFSQQSFKIMRKLVAFTNTDYQC